MPQQQVVKGDSYKDAAKYIDDKTVIVTDPPYNIDYHYRTYSDNKKDEEFWLDLAHLLSQAPSCVMMYPESLFVLARYLDKIPLEFCTWAYNANTPRQSRCAAYFDIRPDFTLYKQPYKDMNDKRCQARFAKTGGARSYDWKECPQVKNKNKTSLNGITHPCEMPVEICKWLVGIIPPEYKILDPFCGSGSFGVACKELDRDFIGIELDENYIALAEDRLARKTLF